MDYARLQFAATVRELAVQLRNAARPHFYKTMGGSPNEEKDAAIENWNKENPTTNFIPKALTLILDADSVIQSQLAT